MGGPARQDAPKAIEALKELNVPYMVSLPLVFQTTEEWLGRWVFQGKLGWVFEGKLGWVFEGVGC